MSYRVRLGDIDERYDEHTGETHIYSLDMMEHSGYDNEYMIVKRTADAPDSEELIFSMWSAEATKLGNLLREN